MASFVCRVGTSDGAVAVRTLEAADEGALRNELARQGARLFSVTAAPGTASPGKAATFSLAGLLPFRRRGVKNQGVPHLQPGARGAPEGRAADRERLRHSPRAAGEPALQGDPQGRPQPARLGRRALGRLPLPRRRLPPALRDVSQGRRALGRGRKGAAPLSRLPEDPRRDPAQGDGGPRLSGGPHRPVHRARRHPDDVRHPEVPGVLRGLRAGRAAPHHADGDRDGRLPARARSRHGGGARRGGRHSLPLEVERCRGHRLGRFPPAPSAHRDDPPAVRALAVLPLARDARRAGTPLVPALDIAAGAVANRRVSGAVAAVVPRVREGAELWRSLEETGIGSRRSRSR